MPVRVPLRIKSLAAPPDQTAILCAAGLVNTGFEASRAECSLPAEAARRLGLWPALPEIALPMRVGTYGGEAIVFAVPDAIAVSVGVQDRAGSEVKAWAIITTTDDEIVISDALAEALAIVLVKPQSGLWIFADEAIHDLRPSVPATNW